MKKSTAIQSHSLGHAGKLTQRASQYFGIDLTRLPQMSDQELAQFADRAIAMKRLRSILPILEKHFTELIEGQVEYEQFIARVLKQTENGSKYIDKSILDAWLLSRGYDKHLQLMNQKAGLEATRQDAEFRSEFDLNRLDFSSAMRLIHRRHRNRTKQVGEKIPNAIRQQEIQERLRKEGERRRELLTYGTAGKPGNSFFQNVRSFFAG